MFEPSSDDHEKHPGGPPPLSPDSHPKLDPIEEMPKADQDLDMVIPVFIEPQDSAPLQAREIIPYELSPLGLHLLLVHEHR